MKLSPNWIREFVELPADNHRLAEDLTSIGIAVEGIAGEGANTAFEMEITTNRPDAMNHYGVAREAAAFYRKPLRTIEPKLPQAKAGGSFPIAIEDSKGCARFTARILRNVKIQPSPKNIVDRLGVLDQRGINNVVDATNYVLWEIGKPTHVFDLDLLEGGKIVVRRARDGETLRTLDGIERKLTAEDLVVADAKRPVGLAGTMGGFDTMITDKTRSVLIESAWWDPTTVRKMSRRHGLHTDASHRFERGADFESTVLSTDRVAELILQSGGGELIGDVIDVVARRIDQAPIGLRMAEVSRILGETLAENEIVAILERLGFNLLPEAVGEFTVHVPSWRLDIEREIDLIEEIARLHGYNNFANTLPAYAGAVVETPTAPKDRKLRSTCLALGYNEAVSLSFISHEDAKEFSPALAMELENPQSEEASVMRTSIVPGMLNMVGYNLNRGNDNVRLFEMGEIWEASGQKAAELRRICLGATGSALPPSVHQAARPLTFFDIKGDVQTLLEQFDYKSLHFEPGADEQFHPGRSARAVMDGATVAQFGQLHPQIASARKLRQDVYLGEVYLDRLYTRALRDIRYEPLPRFPGVERDFSFTFPDEVVFEKIQKAVDELNIRDLQSFAPAEIFRGGSVPAGKYSVLLRARFQSGDRTLREEEVAQWSAQVVKTLESVGGTLRK